MLISHFLCPARGTFYDEYKAQELSNWIKFFIILANTSASYKLVIISWLLSHVRINIFSSLPKIIRFTLVCIAIYTSPPLNKEHITFNIITSIIICIAYAFSKPNKQTPEGLAH